MKMHIENPKDSTKIAARIGEFSKTTGYRSISKTCILYTNNERLKIEI